MDLFSCRLNHNNYINNKKMRVFKFMLQREMNNHSTKISTCGYCYSSVKANLNATIMSMDEE